MKDGETNDGQHDEAALSPTKRTLLAVRTLRAKLDRLEADAREPIAVVGMSCRFPGGADGADAFWALLSSGVDAIAHAPENRPHAADAGGRVRELLGWGGFLRDVDGFDRRFFGIDRHEADWMDPQARLFLEVAWEALEDAGIPPERLRGTRSGVFLGAATHDYACLQTAQSSPDDLDLAYPLGASHAAIVGRTAYLLDLRGPAIAFDTACSSALVAVHHACRSLRSREVDLAIVGGVNAILSPEVTVAMRNAGWLSADGRCRPFDGAADGFARGEGCGVVVLKRLSDALADGDAPRASIRGSAVNHNGRSAGLVAPSARAQREAIEQALEDAGVAPAEVGYVEAHGSSTRLGDPIELDALRAVFGEPRGEGSRCAIGSVKGNLGHLEAASGIAALIKTVLVLERATIPPQVHFRHLTPHGSIAGTPLFVPRAREPWPGTGRPRRAGVSSFSFTGTNAHVILEEAPAERARPGEAAEQAPSDAGGHGPAALHVLPLSARDDEVLRALAGATAEMLRSRDHAIADVCSSASDRRAHHPERVAVVGRDSSELAERLAAFAQRRGGDDVRSGHVPPGRRARTLFLFPGTIPDGVTEELLLCRREGVREAVERWEDLLGRTEAASFVAQMGLVALWRSLGVTPHAVAAEGLGAVAAACVAGALSAADAATTLVEVAPLLGRGAAARGEIARLLARRSLARPALPFVSLRDGAPRETLEATPEALTAATLGRGALDALEAARTTSAPLAGRVLGVRLGGASSRPEGGRPAADATSIVASLGSGVPVEDACVRGLASLYVAGASIDWSRVHGAARRFVRLPAHRWRHERCWFAEPVQEPGRHAEPAHAGTLEAFP